MVTRSPRATLPDRNSTSGAHASKPGMPTPDFRLCAHPTARWSKNVGGKLVCFGPWADPAAALAQYQDCLVGKTAEAPSRPAPSDGSTPERPDGSPVFRRARGRWAKKIVSVLHYFGRARTTRPSVSTTGLARHCTKANARQGREPAG